MPQKERSRELERLHRKLGVELLWIYLLSMLKKKPSHAYVLRRQVEEKFGFLPGNVSGQHYSKPVASHYFWIVSSADSQ